MKSEILDEARYGKWVVGKTIRNVDPSATDGRWADAWPIQTERTVKKNEGEPARECFALVFDEKLANYIVEQHNVLTELIAYVSLGAEMK